MTLSALDDVLRDAVSVRISEVEWYGEIVVDLAEDGGRLRETMKVAELPGHVCACRGQVRFEFLDAQGERLTVVVLHHGISLWWSGWPSYGELADGVLLLRWLAEHGMPGPMLPSSERPERLAWIAAIPPALAEMTGDLVGHFETAADSKHVVEARKRMRSVDPVCRVLQLLK